MADASTPLRILGSTAAGAVGFVVGYYAGFFLVLAVSSPGGALLAVAVAGGLGVIGAGLAIALSVRPGRRAVAFLTTAFLGVVLLLAIHFTASDFGSLMVGAAILVIIVSALVRTGATDVLAG